MNPHSITAPTARVVGPLPAPLARPVTHRHRYEARLTTGGLAADFS